MSYAVVYHMEGWTPDQLKRMQAHHKRDGKDTEHCDPRRFEMNEVIHGNRDTWADDFLADVERVKELNLENEVAALDHRGRRKEAARRHKKGHQDPWKTSGTLGCVRSIVLTANAEWFRQAGFEEFEGADFRDRKKVQQFKQAAVAYLDREIGREHCLFMVYETDEKAPHIHAYYACWIEKEMKTKGRQRMLQPTNMKHFRNAEKAQDSVAEWFAPMGLVRGKKTAKERRRAKREGKMPPMKRKHQAPWQWRQAERLALIDVADQARAERAKADARIEAAEAAEEGARRAKAAALEEVQRKQEKARLARIEEGKKLRGEHKERNALIQKRDKEIEGKKAEQEAREKDLDKRERNFSAMLNEFIPLAETVKEAARKVGLVDHPLVQTTTRGIEKMRGMIGKLGGRQR
ncbi:hypothetical protein [Roseovarius sp.]|uniref:hypothetical protein n=1 Tax=Roseovarius sp. TaxID=1486281 RepID=UPI003B5AB97D